VGANGNIYAANFGSGFIQVFNKDYKHTNTIDVRDWLGPNVSGGFEGPIGIAHDPDDDSLIFTTIRAQSNDTGSYKITRSGSLIKEFGPSFRDQFDCRITDSGILLIKDVTLFANAVMLFNSKGDFIKKWVAVGNNPYGLALDSEENIYVVVGPKTINVYKGTDTSTPIRTITSPNFLKLGGMDILR
jgi:DNA-binding beta-propeller fold protein YncE